jgi:hypothetical protein
MDHISGRLPGAAMLTHFTRRSATGDALDNLASILRDGAIRPSLRMIPGGRAAVCLFDAPIAELGRVLTPSNRRRYEPFGVALDKRYAFRLGARPAIYLPLAEAERIIAHEELWRVAAVDFDRDPPVDWTFEREWRIRDKLPLTAAAVAIVESWRDVDDIYERFAGAPPCAGVIPLKELFGAT